MNISPGKIAWLLYQHPFPALPDFSLLPSFTFTRDPANRAKKTKHILMFQIKFI